MEGRGGISPAEMTYSAEFWDSFDSYWISLKAGHDVQITSFSESNAAYHKSHALRPLALVAETLTHKH